MNIEPLSIHVLEAAGYKIVPVHYENDRHQKEYIRSFDLIGFPRYHLTVTSGKWELHYDVTAQHGNDYPGSVLSSGYFLDKELHRINQARPVGLIKIWEHEIQVLKNRIVRLEKKISQFHGTSASTLR